MPGAVIMTSLIIVRPLIKEREVQDAHEKKEHHDEERPQVPDILKGQCGNRNTGAHQLTVEASRLARPLLPVHRRAAYYVLRTHVRSARNTSYHPWLELLVGARRESD